MNLQNYLHARTLRMVGAAPPISTSGDCAICAFFTAVIVLVTPGPAVTAATPVMPVRRDMASAAKTQLTSCLKSTTVMPSFFEATSIGEIWPPIRVNRC